MGEEERIPIPTRGNEVDDNEKASNGFSNCMCTPFHWFRMLSREVHWSLVFGVMIVYGISQGFGGALARVGTQYYMKDVQKVQPSEAQVYSGITSIPWIVKPLWGLLTDVVPISGYHRRPYFVFAGFIGVVSMLFLSVHKELHIVLALLSLAAGSASVAIADVTIDACVAQKSGTHQSLASDLQSLCALSASIGSLIGFSLSGIFVHLIGPQGVFGILIIPAGLVLLVGILLEESRGPTFAYEQINESFVSVGKAMWKTLKCPDVWRPCLYMYLSFSLSLNISEGMFYWATDSKDGPSFSEENMGFIMAIGSIGSLIGTIIYQYGLKNYPFHDLLFWTQQLSCLSGTLDLVLVLRWNLKIRIPDYFFVVMYASVSQMIGRLKWMPLLVLSSKLCPPGIEGTFFALLMSIDNVGLLTSSWFGGLLLYVLKVTRTDFDNIWLAILIRNFSRVSPLFLLFLVPRTVDKSFILLDNVRDLKEGSEVRESEDFELVALINRTD